MLAEALSICAVVFSGVCTALGTPGLQGSPLLSFEPSPDTWCTIHHALLGDAQPASHSKGNCLCSLCYVVKLGWPRYDEVGIFDL